MFSSCEQIFNSDYQGVHAQLAALQAEQLRAADALTLVCRRIRALLHARPLLLQLSFRVPLRAAALEALLSPELAGRVEALHLWSWHAPLSDPGLEQLLGVLQNQAGSLRRLVLEGHPAALLGRPGVDLRCLRQLTELEVFPAEALRLVPATMPQGLMRMVCTTGTEEGARRHIAWAADEASAPPGCLPHLNYMHIRACGRFSWDAEYARPGMHVHLSGCPCSNGEFYIDRALPSNRLQISAARSIFHMAGSVSVSGYSMGLACWLENTGTLPRLLEIGGPMYHCLLRAQNCLLMGADGYHIPIPMPRLAALLRSLISAFEGCGCL